MIRAATMPGVARGDNVFGRQPVQAGTYRPLRQPGVADQRGHRRERARAVRPGVVGQADEHELARAGRLAARPAGTGAKSSAQVAEQRDEWPGRPIVRRPALDLTPPAAWRVFGRCGQVPGVRPQLPPQPCANLGRSRERRTRRTPWSGSTSSQRCPSASPAAGPAPAQEPTGRLLRRPPATSSRRWISRTPYGSTSFSSSFGALASSTGLRPTWDRRTASFSAARSVRWTWPRAHHTPHSHTTTPHHDPLADRGKPRSTVRQRMSRLRVWTAGWGRHRGPTGRCSNPGNWPGTTVPFSMTQTPEESSVMVQP